MPKCFSSPYGLGFLEPQDIHQLQAVVLTARIGHANARFCSSVAYECIGYEALRSKIVSRYRQ